MQADETQRRVRELEEQIESDDRAERLEATLQHTQDHAADLELQVSKLKQVRTSITYLRVFFPTPMLLGTISLHDRTGRTRVPNQFSEGVGDQLAGPTC